MSTNTKWLLAGLAIVFVVCGGLYWDATRRTQPTTPTGPATQEPSAKQTLGASRARTVEDFYDRRYKEDDPDGWAEVERLLESTRAPSEPMTFRLISDEVSPKMAGLEVDIDGMVSGGINEERLRSLLSELFRSMMSENRTRAGQKVVWVFIRVYASREYLEAQQPIAILRTLNAEHGFDIAVMKRQLAHLYAKPEARFGLSDSQRKQVYKNSYGIEEQVEDRLNEDCPAIASEALPIGQMLTFTKAQALYKTMQPRDSSAAAYEAWEFTNLPPGATVRVERRSRDKRGVWYYVEAWTGHGNMRTDLCTGYVNSLELGGNQNIPSQIGERITQEALRKRSDLRETLTSEYRDDLAKRNGISLDQLKEIEREGQFKDWPEARIEGNPLTK